jgi:putative colanic acid biosynthesis acetyltransferase WcaF
MIDIHPTANFGHRVKLYVQSHNPMPGMFGDVVARPIKIEANAWIASECILFNCLIGEGAILAVGSVVRSKIVPPWVMVEGNPGRIFKRFINGGWHGCSEELGAMHR